MRLIDADKIDYYIIHNPDDDDEYMRFITDYDIENAPTIDAVEVVRCKDCKHWISELIETSIGNFRICAGWELCTDENDYCSHGERKD